MAATLLGLAPFVVLECLLTLFDVGSRGRLEDPLVGFSRIQPLFELDEAGEVYRTARCRQSYFGQQQFVREKPDETFRVFGLGGSTMRGRPYETDTSFLKWLEMELNGRDSTRRYETVNCGGLSYASYRLTWILDEVLRYEPDLIIIAAGHNEFLEDRTYDSIKDRSPPIRWMSERLYSLRSVTLARELFGRLEAEADSGDGGSLLETEVHARLDDESGYASYHRDEQWRRNVVDDFERSVRRMVDACRQARVPLVLVNLGENLRDCPPFKSEHKSGLPALSLQRWREFFDTATQCDEASPAEALQAYRKAESIDDQYALLIYRMARCFDRLGETEQARQYYARAKELDVCPLRMLDEMHQRLKQIALDTNTSLLDARQLLVESSPDGIPGNNCFMDHVHPSIGSHQRIARALALQLEEMSLVVGNRDWTDGDRRLVYRRHFRQLGPAYLSNGRRRVDWLESWARRHRLESGTLPKDACGHLHLGHKRLDYGEIDLAWEQYQLAMEEDPSIAEDVLGHALELFKQGRGGLAEKIVLRLSNQPEAASLLPQTELARVILAFDAGRMLEAAEAYNRSHDAVEQAAQSSTGWLALAPDALEQIKSIAPSGAGAPPSDPRGADARTADSDLQDGNEPAASKLDSAIRLLDEAVRRDPQNARLYFFRARLHFAKQDFDAALEDSTEAVRLAPDRPDGYKIRALTYTMQGSLTQAVADLTKAIEIDPSDPDLFTARAKAYQGLGEETKAEVDFAAARSVER